jgi:hypothetical protein
MSCEAKGVTDKEPSAALRWTAWIAMLAASAFWVGHLAYQLQFVFSHWQDDVSDRLGGIMLTGLLLATTVAMTSWLLVLEKYGYAILVALVFIALGLLVSASIASAAGGI